MTSDLSLSLSLSSNAAAPTLLLIPGIAAGVQARVPIPAEDGVGTAVGDGTFAVFDARGLVVHTDVGAIAVDPDSAEHYVITAGMDPESATAAAIALCGADGTWAVFNATEDVLMASGDAVSRGVQTTCPPPLPSASICGC